MKPYNSEQTNESNQIEMITRNHMIISLRYKYLKTLNCKQIICIW